MADHVISDPFYLFLQSQIELVIGYMYSDPYGWTDSYKADDVRAAYQELRDFAKEVGLDFDVIAAQRSDFERQRMREIIDGH